MMNKITQSLIGLSVVFAAIFSSGCASTKSVVMFNSNQLPDSELITLKVRDHRLIKGAITYYWIDAINGKAVPEGADIVQLSPGTYKVTHSCAIFSRGKLGRPQTKDTNAILTRDQASEFTAYAERPSSYSSSAGGYYAVGCRPMITRDAK